MYLVTKCTKVILEEKIVLFKENWKNCGDGQDFSFFCEQGDEPPPLLYKE